MGKQNGGGDKVVPRRGLERSVVRKRITGGRGKDGHATTRCNADRKVLKGSAQGAIHDKISEEEVRLGWARGEGAV